VRDQNSPASTASTAVAQPDAESATAGKKRRRKKDGGSSTSSINSDARQAKSHQPGGIGKFLSVFLNCCRAPDAANDGTGDDQPSRKVRKPVVATSGSRRSSPVGVGKSGEQKETSAEDAGLAVNEKSDGAEPSIASTAAPTLAKKEDEQTTFNEKQSTLDKELPPIGHEETHSAGSGSGHLMVKVDPPTPQAEESSSLGGAKGPEDADVEMTAALPVLDEGRPPVASPPPPEAVIPEEEAEDLARASAEFHAEDMRSLDEKPQGLLPPIAPEFKGKKCLVLDLDETLVHSSFKVGLMSSSE
jgi:carboxy-terminal domain RNA polymerase II polypeptide A small phosphatase